MRSARGAAARQAAQRLFVAACAGLAIVGCSTDSPTGLRASNNLTVPDHVMFATASGSSKATAVSWSEIDITWAASPSVSGYQVWRSTNGAAGTYTQIATTPATVSSYADTGLLGSTQYCYEVRSFKSVGKSTNYSAFTSAVCATTPAPPILPASQTDARPEGKNIRLTWKDNSDNEDGFRLELASTPNGTWYPLGTVGPNVTTAAGFWQSVEQQACFRVTAFNAAGSASSSPTDCTTNPYPPTNLSAKVLDGQSITLAWTDNSSVEDNYEVLKRDPSGVWTSIATLAPNTTSYRDAAVTAEVLYTYHVRALKDGGYSEIANEVSAAIRASLPAAPTNAWAEIDGGPFDWGGDSRYIAWTDASSNEDGFRIEYSVDGGQSGWTFFANTPADTPGYADRGFFGGGCWRIMAYNSLGLSAPSNVACAELHPRPTGVVATVVDQQTIDVTWNDNASYETGYEVMRSLAGGAWESIAVLPANTTSFRDTGLTPGADYCYFISMIGEPYLDDDPDYGCATPAVTASAGIQSSAPPIVRTVPTRRIHINRRPAPPTAPRFRRTR
ncbi:MAG TPA: fibronectin type III domain-containing protein [Gemmatimonadaceae bacterium]|nr:fibronectin type III domain-containing protein [Gemmatimonadaceae bacterium]